MSQNDLTENNSPQRPTDSVTSTDLPAGMIVPVEKLSDEALEGLVSEFILREGTDYGKHEYSLEQKRDQVLKQLQSERVYVVFDFAEQSCSILRKEEIPKSILQKENTHG